MRPPETDSPEKDSAANKNLPVITNRASKTTTKAKRLRLNGPSGELLGDTRAHFSLLFLEAASFSGKSVFGGRIIFGRTRPYHFGQIGFRRPHHFRAQKAVSFRAPFISPRSIWWVPVSFFVLAKARPTYSRRLFAKGKRRIRPTRPSAPRSFTSPPWAPAKIRFDSPRGHWREAPVLEYRADSSALPSPHYCSGHCWRSEELRRARGDAV